jgi:hypothetical protein
MVGASAIEVLRNLALVVERNSEKLAIEGVLIEARSS